MRTTLGSVGAAVSDQTRDGRARVTAYYNEFDAYAAQWLRNLIDAGHIAPGIVDERSIVEVQPCPCQPFSVAGARGGVEDERHLWPEFARLIGQCRPAKIIGEQVSSTLGREWLSGVRLDLEAMGYGVGAVDIGAASVGAPHIRQRLWWVADSESDGRGKAGRDEPRTAGGGKGARQLASGGVRGGLADTHNAGLERLPELDSDEEQSRLEALAGRDPDGRSPVRSESSDTGRSGEFDGGSDGSGLGDTVGARLERHAGDGNYRDQPGRIDALQAGSASATGSDSGDPWADVRWIDCADGKARRLKCGIEPLAHGIPGRVGQLRAYGNAICPQVAAEILMAWGVES